MSRKLKVLLGFSNIELTSLSRIVTKSNFYAKFSNHIWKNHVKISSTFVIKKHQILLRRLGVKVQITSFLSFYFFTAYTANFAPIAVPLIR